MAEHEKRALCSFFIMHSLDTATFEADEAHEAAEFINYKIQGACQMLQRR